MHGASPSGSQRPMLPARYQGCTTARRISGVRLADAGTGKTNHQLPDRRHPLPALDHVELDCAPQPTPSVNPSGANSFTTRAGQDGAYSFAENVPMSALARRRSPSTKSAPQSAAASDAHAADLGTAERTHGEPKCRLVVMDVFVDVQEVTVEIARPARFREVCHALSEIGLEIVHRRHRGRSAGFAWLVCHLP